MFWKCLHHGHSSRGVKTELKALLFTQTSLPQSLSRPTPPSLPKLFSDTPEAILTPHGGKTNEQNKNWKLTFFQLNNAPYSKNVCLLSDEFVAMNQSNQSIIGFQSRTGILCNYRFGSFLKTAWWSHNQTSSLKGFAWWEELLRSLFWRRMIALRTNLLLQAKSAYIRYFVQQTNDDNFQHFTFSKNKSELSNNVFAMCSPSLRPLFRKWHAKFCKQRQSTTIRPYAVGCQILHLDKCKQQLQLVMA